MVSSGGFQVFAHLRVRHAQIAESLKGIRFGAKDLLIEARRARVIFLLDQCAGAGEKLVKVGARGREGNKKWRRKAASTGCGQAFGSGSGQKAAQA